MELNVFSSEKFERTKWRYVGLTVVILIVLGLCVFYKNITGFILIFIILGGYIYLGLISLKEIKLKITDNGLILDDKLIPREKLTGYTVEINQGTQTIKNIVLHGENTHRIHTVCDTETNTKNFIIKLNDHLPMIGEYSQGTREKLSRLLKL